MHLDYNYTEKVLAQLIKICTYKKPWKNQSGEFPTERHFFKKSQPAFSYMLGNSSYTEFWHFQ